MAGKTQYWTGARLEHAIKEWHSDIAKNGKNGSWVRLGNKLRRKPSNVQDALRRIKTWSKIRAEADVIDTKWREKHAPKPDPAKEPAVPLDPTDARIRTLDLKNTKLTDELNEIRRKLRAGDRQAGIVLELAETLRESVKPLQSAGPIHTPVKKVRGAEDVDAIVMMSDQHADLVVHEEGTYGLERYDFNVFRARLWEWAKTIKSYTYTHLPKYKFDTLWVWHLGDAVHGDIHNNKLRNHWHNSLRAAIAVGDAQAQALMWLAPYFKRIVVVCISGNHGRTTMQIEHDDPYDNFDYLVAETMRLRLRGVDGAEKIQIEAPRSWSAHVEVRGKLWSLNHGMGVRGTWGIPWYGFERREGRVQRLLAFVDRKADYFAYGHFHQAMTRPAGQGKAVHAGAWFMSDAWSVNALSVGNEPEQQLLMFSERFGRQMEIPIYVRDREQEAKLHAGEWEPPFGPELIGGDVGASGGLPVIR